MFRGSSREKTPPMDEGCGGFPPLMEQRPCKSAAYESFPDNP
jgi:hypothetical protein